MGRRRRAVRADRSGGRVTRRAATVAGRFDDVVNFTDGLSNEDDASAILLVFRGHALRMLGHYTAARETLRDSLRSSERDRAILQWALIERAYAYLGEDKKSQAKP